MSLDVYLTRERDETTDAEKAIALLRANDLEKFAFELECRHSNECGPIELYSANYTHNCNMMATEAGIYEHVWHPDQLGITKASQLIEPLKAGIALMASDPKRFEKFNPENGWGSYATFLLWLRKYLSACEDYPEADVRTCT